MVAGSDPQRLQAQQEGVGARRDRDRVLDPAQLGEGVLEGLDLRSLDVAPAAHDAQHRLLERRSDGLPLGGEVQGGHLTRRAHLNVLNSPALNFDQ